MARKPPPFTKKGDKGGKGKGGKKGG